MVVRWLPVVCDCTSKAALRQWSYAGNLLFSVDKFYQKYLQLHDGFMKMRVNTEGWFSAGDFRRLVQGGLFPTQNRRTTVLKPFIIGGIDWNAKHSPKPHC